MLKIHFGNLPINYKLNLIIMLVSTIILLVTSVAYFFHQSRVLQHLTTSELETLSNVISDSSTAALSFNHKDGARDILNSLAAKPNVVQATIYTASGDVFAKYASASGHKVKNLEDLVTLNSDIVLDGETIGKLELKADFSHLKVSRTRFVQFLWMVFALSLGLACVISSRLQRYITTPISRLSLVMESISRNHDFSLRVDKEYNDELGTLCQGFNSMLERIEKQDNELQRQKDSLCYMANHDTLTGLPNRALLYDRLNLEIHHAQRNRSELMVVFIDLDHFKTINDSLGHDIGDDVLVTIAERLNTALRSVDTIARFGGDEFVILFTDVELSSFDHIAAKILSAIRQPFIVQGRSMVVTTSIGASCYPTHGEDPGQLIKFADVAMYQAKNQGRNSACLYRSEMTSVVDIRFELESHLHGALERNEFFLNYQPQYDLHDGSMCGCEVLLRWRTEKGLVSPMQFIPVMEENGMIEQVGPWVLAQACRQAAQWLRMSSHEFIVAVNVSARQFFSKDLIQQVAHSLKSSGLPAYCLEIEITETMLMADAERAIVIMEQISALGVKIAIDDFGTGYSSLNYLKRFPINKLKVDRCFIQDALKKTSDATIVEAIISLGLALNLQVIAEGIETQEQLDYLVELNCMLGQGFLMSKPLSARDFTDLLSQADGVTWKRKNRK